MTFFEVARGWKGLDFGSTGSIAVDFGTASIIDLQPSTRTAAETLCTATFGMIHHNSR